MAIRPPWSQIAGRWIWSTTRSLVLVLIIGLAVYQFRFGPIPADGHPVRQGAIVAEVMGTGTLEARVSTTISPKISGRVAEVLVDQGDLIERGMLLVRLDDDEFQQQVAIGEANVEAAHATIARLIADKERATVVFEQAERNHARIQNLVQQSVTTQEEFEKAAEALAVAVADVSRAEAAITGGQKELVAAEKTLQYHQARLQDTKIAAPFHGLVVARQREAGDVVVPGSSILTLISTDILWIESWVDETEMSKLEAHQSARVVFRSEPDTIYPGKVIRLGREADRETREFVVDVQVLELPKNWAVGQRAEVYIETARKHDVMVIPAHLPRRTEDGQLGVMVHDQGRARIRPIAVGLRGRDMVEVMDGLDRSDVLLTPGDDSRPLIEGRRVTLR